MIFIQDLPSPGLICRILQKKLTYFSCLTNPKNYFEYFGSLFLESRNLGCKPSGFCSTSRLNVLACKDRMREENAFTIHVTNLSVVVFQLVNFEMGILEL